MQTNIMPKPKKSTNQLLSYLTTITPLSKGLALGLFITLPFFTFLGGIWYGENFTRAQLLEHFSNTFASNSSPQACTEDAYICPDGSSVGRTGPNCSFAPCPSSSGPEQVACTMDAMQCPDGSYVGRQSPTCEFSPCPQSNQ